MAVKIFISLVIFSTTVCGQTDLPRNLQKENARMMQALEEDNVDAEKISKKLKDWYWAAYMSSAEDILKTDKLNENVIKEQQKFQKLKEPLVGMEHKEDEADELEEKVNTHVKLLNDKIYHIRYDVFIEYMTWQQSAEFKSPSRKSPLIITNHGLCAGGTYGYRNAFYHGFIDGCLFQGYGNIGSVKPDITYRQSNVPVYGMKASLGGGMIVSSKGAEVGLKIPLLYNHQPLDNPNQASFPNSEAEENSPLLIMGSIYARWPVDSWFVQTEFSKVFDQELTQWGVGLGYKF